METAVHVLLYFGALVVALAALMVLRAHNVDLVGKLAGLFIAAPSSGSTINSPAGAPGAGA